MEHYKQLRKDKKKTILRSDKLFTDDGVFTYDLQQQTIVRLETLSFRRKQAAADTHSDAGKDRDIVTTDSDVIEGVASTDPNADEGQGATAANFRVYPPGRRGCIVTHTHTKCTRTYPSHQS